jgi:hypothetical protein
MIRRGSLRPCCVVPGCSWWWFPEPFLGVFLELFSGPFSWGFDGGNLWEPFVVLWAVIPRPNPWVKGLNFGVFRVLGFEVFLAGFLRFHTFPSPANRPEHLPVSPRSWPRRALPRSGAGLAGGRHAAPCAAWCRRTRAPAQPRLPNPTQIGP